MDLEKPNFGFDKKISEIKKNILSKKEYDFINLEILKLLEKDLGSNLTKDDGHYLEELSKKIDSSGISVKTISEFKILLEELGIRKDYIEDILSHENAHANKAEELGGEKTFKNYSLTVIKNPVLRRLFSPSSKKYFVEPSAKIEVPESLNEQEKKDFISAVAGAPEEYGNKLSKSDSDVIEKLK